MTVLNEFLLKNISSDIENKLSEKARLNNFPLGVTIELTYSCNLTCSYCYVPLSKRKTKYLSKEKIEKLATYCIAKFWNIDTFLDRERVSQVRTRKKTPLFDFIVERAIDLQFLGKAGSSLKKEDFITT